MHAFLSAALTLNLKIVKTIVFRGLFEVWGKIFFHALHSNSLV